MTALFSGCAGILEEADKAVSGELKVVSRDSRNTAMGNVEIGAQIQNTGSDSKSGTLVAQVDVEGGDTHTQRKSVTVPGDQLRSYTVSIDIPMSDSLTGFEYRYDAWIQ
ncbi:hypothetical protein [Salinarchaeum laminariae]|uniref:hypothetical protein n=1 Tax=Salinarchaeum laminariae TaxID=869888 RepID=UPI0020C0DD79|nr:hypothetical protein [Salinarchaeum laminariae]